MIIDGDGVGAGPCRGEIEAGGSGAALQAGFEGRFGAFVEGGLLRYELIVEGDFIHFGSIIPIPIPIIAIGISEIPRDSSGAEAFGRCRAEEFDRGDDEGGGRAGRGEATVDDVYEAAFYDAGGAVAVLDEVVALLLAGEVLDVVAAGVAAGEEVDFEVGLLGHFGGVDVDWRLLGDENGCSFWSRGVLDDKLSLSFSFCQDAVVGSPSNLRANGLIPWKTSSSKLPPISCYKAAARSHLPLGFTFKIIYTIDA